MPVISYPKLDADQLRLTELENVRLKLMQIIDTLNTFLTMHPSTPWPIVHAQFTAIISSYSSLEKELENPYLKQLLAHPFVLPSLDPDFVPRVLLRSKPLPELETNIPTMSINVLDEMAVKEALRHAQLQLELHDDIVKEAIKSFQQTRDEYDFKMRIEEDEDDQSEEEAEDDVVAGDGEQDHTMQDVYHHLTPSPSSLAGVKDESSVEDLDPLGDSSSVSSSDEEMQDTTTTTTYTNGHTTKQNNTTTTLRTSMSQKSVSRKTSLVSPIKEEEEDSRLYERRLEEAIQFICSGSIGNKKK